MDFGNTSGQKGVSMEPPLPEGWEKRTASSGRVYYYDYNTRSATVDRPPTRRTPSAPPAISNSFDCLGRGGGGSGGDFSMRRPAAPLAQAATLTPAYRVDWKADDFGWKAERGRSGSSVATVATSVASAQSPTLRESITPQGIRSYSSAWGAGSADGGSSLKPPLLPGEGGLCTASSTTMLEEYNDGSMGYVSGGKFEQMYGPPLKSKDVPSVQITRQDAETRCLEHWGIGFEVTNARGRSDPLPNLLFSCDWLEDSDGPVFVQQPWPPADDGIIVRALHPGALRGDGAMVRSHQGMVYVMNATLPTNARRGYLAVQGPEKVEMFLNTFYWKSRSEGYMGAETDKCERVRPFVVKDLFTHRRGTGYYVSPRYSDVDRSRLICHLGPVGALKDSARRHGLIPYKGERTLHEWARTRFPGARCFLFD